MNQPLQTVTMIQKHQNASSPRSSEPPRKRRRSSRLGSIDIPDGINTLKRDNHNMRQTEHTHETREKGLVMSSNSKLAGQTVETFLSKHIPDQYARLGSSITERQQNPNSKFCYRHRPDLKCRRQADEPSMDRLQRDLDTLPQDDRQGIAHVWSLFSAAPSKHRNLMLQGILAQCCFPQLSFLSANVKELIRIDFLSALPTELSFKILCFLDTTSLCKAAQVSRRWRQLADDDVVWHRMCEQHIDRKCTKCGVGLPLLERKRLRATKRQIQLRATGRGLDTWPPDHDHYPDVFENTTIDSEGILSQKREEAEDAQANASPLPAVAKSSRRPCLKSTDSEYFRKTRPWKDVYKDRFKVGTNWKYGRCTVRTFKGHANGVMCLQYLDNVLATGSYDATIKIWDLETGEEIRTLTGHRLGIRCLQMDDRKLISGSLDCQIKVWNWRTGECMATYSKHRDGVIGLHFDGNLMASASIDRTVRIWNFGDKSSYTLKGHGDWVNAVKLDVPSNTAFSASDDFTVKLWDLETKTCLKTYEGHVGQVQQVIPLPPEFEVEADERGDEYDSSATAAADDSASQLSAPTGSPPLLVDAYQPSCHPTADPSKPFGEVFSTSSRPLPPRYMLTSALDSTIRLWDTYSGKCLRTFFGHVEGVWAIAADTLRVVSGAQDRMVKVWDTRTGKCDRTFTGHTRPVTCIGLSDSRICTGSEDGEARVYSFCGSGGTGADMFEGVEIGVGTPRGGGEG